MVALAAASATIDSYVAMDAPAVVQGKEAKIRASLADIAGVDHVRGRGLLLAIELTAESRAGRTGAEIARACLDEGVILNGITPTALRIAPPYTVSDDEIGEAVAVIAKVLETT